MANEYLCCRRVFVKFFNEKDSPLLKIPHASLFTEQWDVIFERTNGGKLKGGFQNIENKYWALKHAIKTFNKWCLDTYI